MINRREEQRYRVRRSGMIAVARSVHTVETVNLSLSGARIVLDIPLLEDSKVVLRLHLQERAFRGLFNTGGIVVWCSEGVEVGFEAGLRIFPRNGDRAVLSAFFEELDKS